MTRIAATEEQTFDLETSAEQAFAFFSQPQEFSKALAGLEYCQMNGSGQVRFVFAEKRDSGIVFQPDYTVQFEPATDQSVRWRSLEGNMGNQGEVLIAAKPQGGCRVTYRETVEPDLPITSLMAKLIKPIVVRELRRDVSAFLQRARDLLRPEILATC